MDEFMYVVAVALTVSACVARVCSAVVEAARAVTSVMDLMDRAKRKGRRRKKMRRRKK